MSSNPEFYLQCLGYKVCSTGIPRAILEDPSNQRKSKIGDGTETRCRARRAAKRDALCSHNLEYAHVACDILQLLSKQRRQDVHHILLKKKVMHSLTLTLPLNLSLDQLANKELRSTNALYRQINGSAQRITNSSLFILKS